MPSRKKSQPSRTWRMYPELHGEVAELLELDDLPELLFHDHDNLGHEIQSYSTNVMGRFTCDNAACSSAGWGSKKVAIFIRLYADETYNARVYLQRCKECNNLGRLNLNEHSYAERVAYRLKKWHGVPVEKPYFGGKKGKPHESSLCEGCKQGHCGEQEL